MRFQSCLFLVEPSELEAALKPFTLVINNRHVPVSYTHTPTEEFIEMYSKLYELLISGEIPDWEKHHELLGFIAITSDLSSVKFGREHIYQGEAYKSFLECTRGSLPYLSPFAFTVCNEGDRLSISTRSSYSVFTGCILGYEMIFPKFTAKEAAYYGVNNEKDYESWSDYELFKKSITSITEPLKFIYNGQIKKTSIRISSKTKRHLPDIYCIRSKGISII